MPKIYGNVQPRHRDYSGLGIAARKIAGWGAVGIVVYGIFFSPLFRVRTVEVEGAALTDVTRAAATVPAGTNLWRLPKSDIIGGVREDPLVLSVRVLRGIPSRVRLVIEEKEPALAWHSGATVTLLDSAGYSITQFTENTLPASDTPAGQRIASIPHIVDTQNIQVEAGSLVTTQSFVRFMQDALDHFATYLPEVSIVRAELSESTTDVLLISSEGLRVQMDTLANAGVQVRNVTRLIQQGKATLQSKIDVRIDRWAYVE